MCFVCVCVTPAVRCAMSANLAGLNQLFLWSVAHVDDAPNLLPTDPARPIQVSTRPRAQWSSGAA